jgi:hypothetical protein
MPIMLKTPRLIWIDEGQKCQGSNHIFQQFVVGERFVSTIMADNKELYMKEKTVEKSRM